MSDFLDSMKLWMRRRNRPTVRYVRPPLLEEPNPQGRAMTGKYLLLYKYLKNRHADTVVLTLAEIEDLLGFALPDQARLRREWWTDGEGGADHADSWILASRSAVPNLLAKTVVFARDASYA